MKLLDENKGIRGEYLKGWVVTEMHRQICRNTRNSGRDLVGEREEPSALFLSEEETERSAAWSGWGSSGRHK
jgi:hypothetical protein